MFAIIVILFIFDEPAKSFNYADCSVYYWTAQNMLMFIATFFSLFSGVNYIIKIYKPSKRVSK
jgi:phosphatidylglycerophosphate synthase